MQFEISTVVVSFHALPCNQLQRTLSPISVRMAEMLSESLLMIVHWIILLPYIISKLHRVNSVIVISTSISWSSAADDARILAASRNFISRANATAYAQGLGNRFLYQNYAEQEQDVFSGYGQENLERLREASRKYDPSGVWQKLQPGYFKLGL
jgi:hypothetical protein